MQAHVSCFIQKKVILTICLKCCSSSYTSLLKSFAKSILLFNHLLSEGSHKTVLVHQGYSFGFLSAGMPTQYHTLPKIGNRFWGYSLAWRLCSELHPNYLFTTECRVQKSSFNAARKQSPSMLIISSSGIFVPSARIMTRSILSVRFKMLVVVT